MLAKKEQWTWVGIEPGVNQSSMMETHVIPNDNILDLLWLPWLPFLLKNVIVQRI